jgi:hypothetical protein
MNQRTPLVCLLCALGLMLLAACGGSGPGTGTTISAGESASTTASAVDMSAGELGDAIGATWSEAMQKLVALLESKPEAVAIQGQVEQLKEEYIGKLVGLGRQREALGVSDKAKAGVRTVAALDAAGDEAWYADYKSLYEHYSEGELGFANLLASFNILTQYAEFELLKQQAPEEATRLGIE